MTAGTRLALIGATLTLTAAAAGQPAIAMTNGGGASSTAPGQENAEANCTTVYSERQENVRAGGGPKSGPSEGPIGTYPDGSGPTNCDHFWQAQGAIGNEEDEG